MNKELWKKCVEFHGHECPGLAIGFRACEIAKEKMDLTFAPDEELVCITENDACGVDAVQVITGCTIGKGNLIYRDTGKMAFSFFSRRTGESLRVIVKNNDKDEKRTRDERKIHILEDPWGDIFEVKRPHYNLPEKARLFNTVICDKCHEGVAEQKITMNNGKLLCPDCVQAYTRGW